MTTIAIIIPIYNRLEITKQGLISLTKALDYYNVDSTKFNYEIIIVDDGCTDGSGDWINLNYQKIHVLRGDGNLWWSGSINLGAKYAIDSLGVDYVLLWNDDLFLDKKYFSILSDFLKHNHPLNYICGSRICFESDKKKVWSVGGYFSKWTGEKYTIRNIKETKGMLGCHWQPGMGTLVPRFVMDDKNIWWDDKKYPQYYGDSDFTLKCIESGIQVKTNLELLIFNRTELTGDTRNPSFSNFWDSLFSIKSFYELKRNFMFYTQHGVVPFVYYGMLKKYISYFLRVLKINF
jgi:GT2 family glycosyltransferase